MSRDLSSVYVPIGETWAQALEQTLYLGQLNCLTDDKDGLEKTLLQYWSTDELD